METIVNILQSNLLIGIILFLVIIPVYHRMGLLGWLFGKNGGSKLENKIDELQRHYNDETTQALGRIEDAIKDGFNEANRKLDDVGKDLIYLKAKQNGTHR